MIPSRSQRKRPYLQSGMYRRKSACKAIGLEGIVHDLRRSGVKRLIDAGIDPHTAMAFRGHRTASMLRRYHIIDVDDLRRAAERAQAYCRPGTTVTVLRDETATSQPPRGMAASHPAATSAPAGSSGKNARNPDRPRQSPGSAWVQIKRSPN